MSAWWITAGESGEEDKEEAVEEEEEEAEDTHSEKVLPLSVVRPWPDSSLYLPTLTSEIRA